MMKNFEDFQKAGQKSVDAYMKSFGDWSKNWQAIASEFTDYSKRSIEQGTATMEKLMTAKSLEQAVETQATYAKSAYDEYMAQVSKLGALYADFAKGAYAPFEKLTRGH